MDMLAVAKLNHPHAVIAVWSGQDWALCNNGSRFHGAVRGAVDRFAMEHGVQVSIT
jgi:hypothetical protein